MNIAPSSRVPARVVDWLKPQLRWVTVPSWLFSLVLHVGFSFLIVFLSQLPSCRRDIQGDRGDSFRQVGIVARPVPETVNDQESDPTADRETASPTPEPQPDVEVLPDRPPVPLSLPENAKLPPVIGTGAFSSIVAVPAEDLVRPAAPGAGGGAASGGAPAGGTSFLGIQDNGRRFVYVIDRSFSMENDNALQAAKLELLSSLDRLQENQEFQVIFYNNDPFVLETRGNRFPMFWGTDPQRLQVREQVRAIGPAGGTSHMPALIKALSYNPDVVFLLTDGAADTALTNAELRELQQRNRHGARIHCIEFGRGPTSSLGTSGNFLRQLAQQHQGQYTYRNVAKQ